MFKASFFASTFTPSLSLSASSQSLCLLLTLSAFLLRILMHKAREHHEPLYICFVDFKKAFDSISHGKLWVTMMDMGYPIHFIDLLAKLYRKHLAKVKAAGTLSEWFRVKKGCVLSPYLFNILAEMVMRETLDGFQGGLQIGGRMITNLRYMLMTSSDHPLGHFGGRTTGIGGSPRPCQPQIQPIHQRRQDQGNGERRHSVPHTHSE